MSIKLQVPRENPVYFQESKLPLIFRIILWNFAEMVLGLPLIPLDIEESVCVNPPTRRRRGKILTESDFFGHQHCTTWQKEIIQLKMFQINVHLMGRPFFGLQNFILTKSIVFFFSIYD